MKRARQALRLTQGIRGLGKRGSGPWEVPLGRFGDLGTMIMGEAIPSRRIPVKAALAAGTGVAIGYRAGKKWSEQRKRAKSGGDSIARPLTNDYLAAHNLTHGKGGRFTRKR